MAITRYQCPCCGYYTLDEPASYDICPICNWEDDGTIDPSKGSGPNHTTLGQAQKNFLDHGDMYELERRVKDLPSWYTKRGEIRKAMIEALASSTEIGKAQFEELDDQYHVELGNYIDRLEELIDSYSEYTDLLRSDEPKQVVNGLLGLVLNCDDMEYAQKHCFSFINNRDANIRGIAVLCFGHLARIHGRITIEWAFPYIEAALKDTSSL